ncbi:MAG: DMT family transporter [Prevotella sp.]|nr:DMT family transporter [Candidatus Prevotella equi]
MKVKEQDTVKGHLYMLTAAAMWGMMAPLGKDAMANGISGVGMVGIRVMGGALLFWLASIISKVCAKDDEVRDTVRLGDRKELLWLFGAGMFAIVFNQCNYIIGLSITSPLNASIMTTTMPIITMVLAALIIKETITFRKVSGLVLGCLGALVIIMTSAGGAREGGVLLGDVMCIAGQFSYAFYLTAFKGVISRHNAITCQKWMMTFAAIVLMPLTLPYLFEVQWGTLSAVTYLETAFVVVGGTFFSFLCSTKAQKILSPTIIAMYNYVQPIVACTLSVLLGLGIFGWSHIAAIILVFSGVYLVTHHK